MSERVPRQYFGPSQRHDRACVELSFAATDESYHLAPVDAALAKSGFKLREYLPEEPLPLEQAVRRLAAAMLARHAEWWSDCGTDGNRAWAAAAFPYPAIAAMALDCALDMLVGGTAQADTAAKLGTLAKRMAGLAQIKLRMLAAAELFGRDTALVNPTADIYQIGQGAKGRHFYRTANERDSLTGLKLEQSKHITTETLRRFGLPATQGVLVSDARQAAQAIERVGLPCVVKPTNMFKGTGVAPGLKNLAEVEAAVTRALKLSQQPVLVENHVDGFDHRLTVMGDELLWVYRKVPARITGDGVATVRELIERENARRAATRDGTDAYLNQIAIDQPLAQFLHDRYGLGLDSALAKDKDIELAGQANIARGGLLEDVSATVHPDNRELAIRVARLFRIHSLGIDYITPDISRSWKETETAILEVNRIPGISGTGDTSLVMRSLFPNRLSGRVPTVVAIGDPAYRGELAGPIGEAFAQRGLRAAFADYLADEAAAAVVQRSAVPHAVETALLDPQADAIVVLCDPERVESTGLALSRCDLLLVQDSARFRWLTATDATIAGDPSAAKLDLAVAKLARTYGDPAEGGPLPALEPIADPPGDAFRLKVWRARAMPKTWFWAQVGVERADAQGLTDHEDLLEAVRALAEEALGRSAKLPEAFTHGELVGPWFRITFEAAIPLPAKGRDEARAALLAATERVNAVAAAKIS
jgi:D-alanine-D-alanine ligase-like ATP-grasp enzyme